MTTAGRREVRDEDVTAGGCASCWRYAALMTRIYTRCNDAPVTTVGLYRERHARHAARELAGLPWRAR